MERVFTQALSIYLLSVNRSGKGDSSEVVECSVYANYLSFFLLSLSQWVLLNCLNDLTKNQI